METVIRVDGLGKKYILQHKRQRRYVALRDVLTEKAKRLTRAPFYFLRALAGKKQEAVVYHSREEFWALRDIAFEVKEGDKVGIIGRNGAGKTTLLRLISRITEPTTGRIRLRGRVATLLEVGTGFHPELTGRENIFLNGAILGMSRGEIRKKFDAIVSFAEMEKFIDTPVKRYSSGMYVRLAFSVAAHLDAEILVIDEVLAVGDIQFQQKCLDKMGSVAKTGRTILFVSHNMAFVKQLCSRCLLLETGKLLADGDSVSVTELYLNKIVRSYSGSAEKFFAESPEKEFQTISVRMLNESGKLTQHFSCDEPVLIELICIVRRMVPGLYGTFAVLRDGAVILVSDTYDFLPNPVSVLSPNKYRIIIKIPPRTLGHGGYTVLFAFTSLQAAKDFYIDSPQEVCSFHLDDFNTVRGNTRDGYLSTLLKWEVSPI